jgi:hypothetical protein
VDLRADLSDEDGARVDRLTAEDLRPAALTVAVATVARAALSLFM